MACQDFPTTMTSPVKFEAEEEAPSTYRHHVGQFPIPTASAPLPILTTDVNHVPKTRGSFGILMVGLAGSRATTVVAGILANRMGVRWRDARGTLRTANYEQCITQPSTTGGAAAAISSTLSTNSAQEDETEKKTQDLPPAVEKMLPQLLANASMAAIGGWDIRGVRLGDALLKAKTLDFDLVRQVQDEMNRLKVFKGYAPLATKECDNHRLDEITSEALKSLRADIRYFKWRNGVVGHTTVFFVPEETRGDDIPPLGNAQELLEAIEAEDTRMPPSILYGTAALLEGCSFVSSSELCGGLMDLAQQQVGVYCLKADLANISTGLDVATMAYLDAAQERGPIKKPISLSSRNSGTTLQKHGHVSEFTKLGFMGQTLSVVTHCKSTSDAAMCAPLLIDAAVWCDYCSQKSAPHDKVVKVLSYVNGKDPLLEYLKLLGNENEKELQLVPRRRTRRVRIRPEEKTAEWAIPHDASIVCAGLACVDMQLNQATGGDGGENIETFAGEKSIEGGSVSMACKTLARLCHGEPLDEDYMEVTPPVVHSVIPLCKIGSDNTGNTLIKLLEESGRASRNVTTKYIKAARDKDPFARTALAVLPIYKDGRRGCFFDAASNANFSSDELMEMLQDLKPPPSLDISNLSPEETEDYHNLMDGSIPSYGAFLFGYPHLLPKLQGKSLAKLLTHAKSLMEDGGIVALDLNGVPEGTFERNQPGSLRSISDLKNDSVIGPALPLVDILHMNEDELVLLTGCTIEGSEESQLEDEFALASAVNLFLMCGVSIVAVTRGKNGCFISCNDEERFDRSKKLPASWVDCTTKLNAMELPPDTEINTNGAGDSFTAGLLVAAMLRHTGMTVPVRNEDKDACSGPHESVSNSGESKEDETQLMSVPAPIHLTPYALYMRENYVTLKAQCNDDKKAIFTRCHEMWENESDDVRALYERKVEEEMEVTEMSMRMEDDLAALDSTPKQELSSNSYDDVNRNLYMANRALNLESAAQFASLVALYHIDTSTRDLANLDVSTLLERAMIFPHGLEEI